MSVLEASLSGSGTSWAASLALLDTREPVSATGASAEAALEALRVAALDQVRDEARVQGLPLTPSGLATVEARVRGACSLALFRLRSPVRVLAAGDPLGTDISTFAGPDGNDLDRLFRPISGQRAVAEAVARRWITPRQGLVYAPSYGEDVRQLLNAPLDGPTRAAIEASLQAQAEADERVESCKVVLTSSGPPSSLTLKISGRLVTAAGPFALTLTVTQLAASLEVLRT